VEQIEDSLIKSLIISVFINAFLNFSTSSNIRYLGYYCRSRTIAIKRANAEAMNLNDVIQRVPVYRANLSLYIMLILLICRCGFRRLYIIHAAIENVHLYILASASRF